MSPTKQTLRLGIIVLAGAIALASCDGCDIFNRGTAPVVAGSIPLMPPTTRNGVIVYEPPFDPVGCYGETWLEGAGRPHVDENDEYCIERDDADQLWLVTGTGLEDWQACNPPDTGNRIPLELVGGVVFRFCVEVQNHPAPPPHGPRHDTYQITFAPMGMSGQKLATIQPISATPGGPAHGGTAHSLS